MLRAIQKVIDINQQRNDEQARYWALCQQRLKNVPRAWTLLTANDVTQSFRDEHDQIRTFRVSDGQEIASPD